jgi:hypothetical protein
MIAPEIVTLPAIIGLPQVGFPTTYSLGTFSGVPDPSVTHTMYFDSTVRPFGYVPVEGDEDKSVFVQALAVSVAGTKLAVSASAIVVGGESVTVPGQPTGLTSTSVSHNSVTLSWTAAVGGDDATGWRVEYKEASSGTWLLWSDSAGTSTTAGVTGLTPSTSLHFRVAGRNAAGLGAYSATYTVSTTAAPAAGAITASWNAPAYDGDGGALSDLDHYTVYWDTDPGGTANSANVSAPTTSYTIPYPGTGTWYVRVVAVDSAGNVSDAGPEISKVLA